MAARQSRLSLLLELLILIIGFQQISGLLPPHKDVDIYIHETRHEK
jgi:hypothetical protein